MSGSKISILTKLLAFLPLVWWSIYFSRLVRIVGKSRKSSISRDTFMGCMAKSSNLTALNRKLFMLKILEIDFNPFCPTLDCAFSLYLILKIEIVVLVSTFYVFRIFYKWQYLQPDICNSLLICHYQLEIPLKEGVHVKSSL